MSKTLLLAIIGPNGCDETRARHRYLRPRMQPDAAAEMRRLDAFYRTLKVRLITTNAHKTITTKTVQAIECSP